ncbi:glucan biosynthesis protein [Methylobacterium iners]|uniref:Glucans biosynthesis protein G n=1 Tax=Methylobacterium iners TaxID=418707 RepID=A0ABQ4S0W2_9HYPH|nr:glucan biosynthesis protein G [Methylobacterium iners]GJD95427.1 Glucans biosynthesis protein G [Methylobacterium iners]
MTQPTRRAVVTGLAAAALSDQVLPGAASAQELGPFGFELVDRRARDLATRPYDPSLPALPEPIARLDYDAWRDIRFRPDRALLEKTRFRLQLFHLGFLYKQPVRVNLVRDRVATPIAYRADLFDFGRTTMQAPLPGDLGFAGIRLHTNLNKPDRLDELIVFVGASYFRFLGRDQLYGLSARGLALNVEGRGGPEEFPLFREFWVEVPEANPDSCIVHALLDSPSLAGAFRFTVAPGEETQVAVRASLHPRVALDAVGLAPLTSMYLAGENDRRHVDDYRPELHDSDGLQIATASGEWLWRPLGNPPARRISSFLDTDPKGFGLIQRDRLFANYQDLEAAYHRRPGYFVEPDGAWGEGSVMLVELPTDTEINDNVVAFWRPKEPYPAGRPVSLSYRLRSTGGALHPGGRVLNTFTAAPAASGAAPGAREPGSGLRRRFLIDFAGGNLGDHFADPSGIAVVASASAGRITATSITPNPETGGLRAALDLALDAIGQSTELRAFLRAGDRALTETWLYPWTAA